MNESKQAKRLVILLLIVIEPNGLLSGMYIAKKELKSVSITKLERCACDPTMFCVPLTASKSCSAGEMQLGVDSESKCGCRGTYKKLIIIRFMKSSLPTNLLYFAQKS